MFPQKGEREGVFSGTSDGPILKAVASCVDFRGA